MPRFAYINVETGEVTSVVIAETAAIALECSPAGHHVMPAPDNIDRGDAHNGVRFIPHASKAAPKLPAKPAEIPATKL